MLAVDRGSLRAALDRLDPAGRALIDLSFGRGIPDDALGELLGTDAAGIARRREELVAALTAQAGAQEAGREAVEAAIAEAVAAPAAGPGGTVVAPAAEPEPEPPAPGDSPIPAPLPVDAPGRSSPLRRATLVALPLAALGAVIAVLAASSGEESPGRDADRTAQPEPEATQGTTAAGESPAEDPEPAPATGAPLKALPGAGRARGSASLTGTGDERRVVLRVRGLPRTPGGYEVWLYDSVADAGSLGRFPGPGISLDAPLPQDGADRRFLDVSREPPDGNENHSGASVLRVPLKRLRR